MQGELTKKPLALAISKKCTIDPYWRLNDATQIKTYNLAISLSIIVILAACNVSFLFIIASSRFAFISSYFLQKTYHFISLSSFFRFGVWILWISFNAELEKQNGSEANRRQKEPKKWNVRPKGLKAEK